MFRGLGYTQRRKLSYTKEFNTKIEIIFKIFRLSLDIVHVGKVNFLCVQIVHDFSRCGNYIAMPMLMIVITSLAMSYVSWYRCHHFFQIGLFYRSFRLTQKVLSTYTHRQKFTHFNLKKKIV